MNITEDHPGYSTLVGGDEAPRLRDVFRRLHAGPAAEEATFHNFSGKRAGRRIDFIFASPEATPVESTIDYSNRDGRYPSDHYPVTAVLKLQPVAEK